MIANEEFQLRYCSGISSSSSSSSEDEFSPTNSHSLKVICDIDDKTQARDFSSCQPNSFFNPTQYHAASESRGSRCSNAAAMRQPKSQMTQNCTEFCKIGNFTLQREDFPEKGLIVERFQCKNNQLLTHLCERQIQTCHNCSPNPSPDRRRTGCGSLEQKKSLPTQRQKVCSESTGNYREQKSGLKTGPKKNQHNSVSGNQSLKRQPEPVSDLGLFHV